MVGLVNFIVFALSLASTTNAFPAYASLAGLPREEMMEAMARLPFKSPPTPPGPLRSDGTKLVNDRAHPYMSPGPGDLRGPCPGMNTLANHGYIPRNGIATPSQIINACQEGFNMENKLATFATIASHLVDGNLLTDLLSIGAKTSKTGPELPAPALVGGLNQHGVFEGDASMSRADAFLNNGDGHTFHEPTFAQFIDFSNRYGGGVYNLTVASELRFHVLQNSIATNPSFTFNPFRFFTSYGESVFALNLFVDGRQANGELDMETARSFFQHHQFPKDFHRAPRPSGRESLEFLLEDHPFRVGANDGINNYIEDPAFPHIDTCIVYEYFVNTVVGGLYPNPTGNLRKALNINLGYLYDAIVDNCTRIYPYGRN